MEKFPKVLTDDINNDLKGPSILKFKILNEHFSN